MGSALARLVRGGHTRWVIYVFDTRRRQFHPLVWPSSFQQLRLALEDRFPSSEQLQQEQLEVEDACANPVVVRDESSFQALVPKYRLVEGEIHLFYVTINIY